jgi:mannose-6-phosphate isomerase-like protein (cupin superfamily)
MKLAKVPIRAAKKLVASDRAKLRDRPVEADHEPASTVKKFSHVKPEDTEYTGGGLRDFFLYRDLGIAEATDGQVICHLVKANADTPPRDGTGWHRHDCEFQIVIMMKGWARFMYEDKPTLVKAGDVVHQRPGIVHYLVRLLAGHGIHGNRKSGRFQDRRHAAGHRQGPAGDALEVTVAAES